MTKGVSFRDKGIGVNQLITYATLVPIFWFVVQPILVEALAVDIKKTVQKEVEPLSSAFIVLLRNNITDTHRKIARLEFRRDSPPPGDWTAQDSEELVDLRIELSSNEQALRALRGIK